MSSKFVVLAAVDMNPGSSLVLERAIAMASMAPDGEVHALAVAEPQVPIAAYPGVVPPAGLEGVDAEQLAAFARKRLDAFKEQNPSARLPHIHVHTSVGLPADEIVWLAAHLDADAIVMATHGRRGVKRLLLGSVAEKVVRLAGCPVVVVREKSHNAAWKVPEIEPVCPDCAKVRADSAGKELWCERHKERHVRAHVLGYGGAGGDSPHAWESSSGT